MNLQKLKMAEALFLQKYPGGFANPEIVAIGKKHKMQKMVALAEELFAPQQFTDPDRLCENAIKLISTSSMVSVFEKPRFRDALRSLPQGLKEEFCEALHDRLYGEEERGFNRQLAILHPFKLAKWTLLTAIPAYLRPQQEVFIKPTTAKNLLATFEIGELTYKPTPSYDFYNCYRELINTMKQQVSKEFSPSNAAFSGFLMMIMDEL